MRFQKAFFRLSIIIAMLLANSVLLPNISPAGISFSGYDFGEVEIQTTKTAVLTISNQEQTVIEISGYNFVHSNCSSFSIASKPESMFIPSNGTLYIGVDFTPTETGTCSDTLRIYTGTPFPSIAAFTGTGIEPAQLAVEPLNLNTQYLRRIEAIESFTQTSIEQGSLKGVGKGKWAQRRLKALTKMLEVTSQMFENGNFEAAHNKLAEIYKKIDGKPKPMDFVEGEAKKTLAAEVYTLIEALKSS
jgi:hypothetical protein